MIQRQSDAESRAVQSLNHALEPSQVRSAIASTIGSFQEEAGSHSLTSWWSFFYEMVGKYRDMYKVVNPHAENFFNAVQYMTVPRWWLEQVGFWGAPGTPPPDKVQSLDLKY
jgi:hypothetical protein